MADSAKQFLVIGEGGNGHLPVRKVPDGPLDHRLMAAAWAALHGGYRGNKYEGPGKAEAIAKLSKLYEREGMTPPGGKKSVDALILEARELGVYDVSQIRDAARELFGFLKPAELKQLLDEFSAGPAQATHRGSELDAGMAQVRRRSVLARANLFSPARSNPN